MTCRPARRKKTNTLLDKRNLRFILPPKKFKVGLLQCPPNFVVRRKNSGRVCLADKQCYLIIINDCGIQKVPSKLPGKSCFTRMGTTYAHYDVFFVLQRSAHMLVRSATKRKLATFYIQQLPQQLARNLHIGERAVAGGLQNLKVLCQVRQTIAGYHNPLLLGELNGIYRTVCGGW